jgi:hypothetical protein
LHEHEKQVKKRREAAIDLSSESSEEDGDESSKINSASFVANDDEDESMEGTKVKKENSKSGSR